MEIKLGSVPLFTDSEALEVFHETGTRRPDKGFTYLVKLQVRTEGTRSTFLPMYLTPAAAQLAALLKLPPM